jgi:hypothetical protein
LEKVLGRDGALRRPRSEGTQGEAWVALEFANALLQNAVQPGSAR